MGRRYGKLPTELLKLSSHDFSMNAAMMAEAKKHEINEPYDARLIALELADVLFPVFEALFGARTMM